MTGLIMTLALGIATIVVATRGLGIFIKSINVLFDAIEDGLTNKLNRRRGL